MRKRLRAVRVGKLAWWSPEREAGQQPQRKHGSLDSPVWLRIHLLTQEGAAWFKPDGSGTVKALGCSVCLLVALYGESCRVIPLLVIQISRSVVRKVWHRVASGRMDC